MSDGTVLAAHQVIVAAGSNVLDGMEFKPELPPKVREAAAQGSASRGMKTRIKVAGRCSRSAEAKVPAAA